MRWSALILSPFFAVAFLLGACGFDESDKTLEEIVDQTYTVNSAVDLRITNGDGSIRIYGADTTEISIEAIKKAYSRERLAKISVTVSAQPDSVSVETSVPPTKTWGFGDRSGTVDYILVVPQTCTVSKAELSTGEVLVEGLRGKNVTANLGNGRLFGHNCFGNFHLSVASGGLDVSYDWWEDAKFSGRAEIGEGNMQAFIPSDAAFRLEAQSEDGQVASDFAADDERRADARKIDMSVGSDPDADFTLYARDGNIRVVETNR